MGGAGAGAAHEPVRAGDDDIIAVVVNMVRAPLSRAREPFILLQLGDGRVVVDETPGL